jgi:hypothetical protein
MWSEPLEAGGLGDLLLEHRLHYGHPGRHIGASSPPLAAPAISASTAASSSGNSDVPGAVLALRPGSGQVRSSSRWSLISDNSWSIHPIPTNWQASGGGPPPAKFYESWDILQVVR